MKLMPLADLLESAGLGVKGGNLFIEIVPTEAQRAIVLRNPPAGTKVNHELPGFFRTEFQAAVRVPASEYAAGAELMDQVGAALSLNNAQVADHLFHYCRARTEPVATALPEGNLVEFAATFDCCFVLG
jgi:hypothetical protein